MARSRSTSFHTNHLGDWVCQSCSCHRVSGSGCVPSPALVVPCLIIGLLAQNNPHALHRNDPTLPHADQSIRN